MASAKRLMEVRHCCRRRRRMAEIRVPACPIPIHHTKLMMSKPQPMGMLMPKRPTPLKRRAARLKRRPRKRVAAMLTPMNQPRGVRRLRTRLLILSVTLPKVWPGPMIGCSALPTGDLRVGVAHGREIRGAGPGLELAQQAIVPGLGLEPGDPALGVVHVAQHDCLRRADRLAGGVDLPLPDAPPLGLLP